MGLYMDKWNPERAYSFQGSASSIDADPDVSQNSDSDTKNVIFDLEQV